MFYTKHSIALFLLFITSNQHCFAIEGRAPPKRVTNWDETERQADVLLKIQSDFAKTHRFSGKIAQFAVDELVHEGFHCDFRYKNLPAYQKNTEDITFERLPMLYCAKPHEKQSSDDTCRIFWAAFELDRGDVSQESHPKHGISQVELRSKYIKDETYFCRVRSDGE